MTTMDQRHEVLEELKKIKGESQMFVMDASFSKWNGKTPHTKKLNLKAKIQSINVTEPLSFSLHAGISRFLILGIYEMRESGENIELQFLSMKERKLLHLMDRVSRKLNISPEEALMKATTFHNRKGNVVEGKSSIFDLSESRKSVAASKLAAMLGKESTGGQWTGNAKQYVKPENILP
jgi:hypothetical protein